MRRAGGCLSMKGPERVAYPVRRSSMIRKVRLEVARCHEFPEGSSAHGYELYLPLAPDGRLDRDLWLKHRQESSFRRFWGDEEETGHLKHGRHGWSLAFPDEATSEAIFRGDEHRFAPGEYLSIEERDGVTRTFRVVAVH
jgi:hypothetical protein